MNLVYFRNLEQNLSFLVPVFIDINFKKCQIFCISRFATDIIAAWIKEELSKVQRIVPHNILVEKLTGDNTRTEKERVMNLFKDGICKVLVCTDVAGMGLDIQDLNLSVNIGIPKHPWKMQQQNGRIGRGGDKSISITMVFPQKGTLAPEKVLRQVFTGQGCIRSSMNSIFNLDKPLIDYTCNEAVVDCHLNCEVTRLCKCSLCSCCSECSEKCECTFSVKKVDEVMESILGLGDDNYRY